MKLLIICAIASIYFVEIKEKPKKQLPNREFYVDVNGELNSIE